METVRALIYALNLILMVAGTAVMIITVHCQIRIMRESKQLVVSLLDESSRIMGAVGIAADSIEEIADVTNKHLDATRSSG